MKRRFVSARGAALFSAIAFALAPGCSQSSEKTVTAACLTPPLGEVISLDGGEFTFGSSDFYPEEGPAARISVAPFDIDVHEVTNAQFAAFIDDTGYITSAERAEELGFPDAGSAVFSASMWSFVAGANWRHPDGPDSSIEGRDSDPVVQISLQDARAYAEWADRALPTEAQWEYAARGGLDGAPYAWGDELTPGGTHMANTWQGLFPVTDSGDDGHMGRAPVGCFAANGHGLYDAIGNVWEWTEEPYYPSHRFDPAAAPNSLDISNGFDPRQPGMPVGVIKGGSFLCAANFCRRYRPAARHAQDTGLGTNHIGFRTVSRS